MTKDFNYNEIATQVLEEFDQSDSFQQRFIGFCDNAMEGKAEDSDLERLINNTELSESQQVDES